MREIKIGTGDYGNMWNLITNLPDGVDLSSNARSFYIHTDNNIFHVDLYIMKDSDEGEKLLRMIKLYQKKHKAKTTTVDDKMVLSQLYSNLIDKVIVENISLGEMRSRIKNMKEIEYSKGYRACQAEVKSVLGIRF